MVAAVGKRTEHWEGFLSALADLPDLELDVLVADVTDLTVRWLDAAAGRHLPQPAPRDAHRSIPCAR